MDFKTAYRLSFEISPIILVGGIAPQSIGGMLPIVALTQAADFAQGLLNGNINLNLDNFFAHFVPLPGSTLINNQVGKYPFANQTIAANAIITQPLNISLKMTCPANGRSGMITKIMTIEALQNALQKHTSLGGTYAVCTPSYIYTNCLLLALTDVSGEDGTQKQREYRWDFEQPLISLSAAQGVQNNLMDSINRQVPIQSPAWSGSTPASLGGTAVGASLGANIGALSPGPALIGAITPFTIPVSP